MRQIVRLRWRQRLGPVQIGGQLGLAPSTVHAVLVRCRINRLSHIDRVTGEPIRRYEHPHPGSMLHVDVTKFGNIPDGGGHRFVGRQQGYKNKAATPGLPRGKDHKPRTGKAFLHTVLDDHSRVAYVEIMPTRRPKPPSECCAGPSRGSPNKASPSSACSLTTAAATDPTPGATPAPSSASPTNAPGPTGHRPTARSKIPPHPGRRLGLRPLLRLRNRTPSRPPRLAPLLQSPPNPLRHRRHAPQQAQQPAWTSHLVRPGLFAGREQVLSAALAREGPKRCWSGDRT